MPNWNEVLSDINDTAAKAQQSSDLIRRKYLNELHNNTERNIIAYYSGWLSKPDVAQTEIIDEDMNGFMMAVHKLDKSMGLDLLLHTPGGNIAATESIVSYLHKMFGDNIRAIVPQIAMSAGTMIACSCKEIVMGEHSSLGPIDPHLSGIPAVGVIDEFNRACKEIKQDPGKLFIWQQIIKQYRPTFLSQCENALEWSKLFVGEQLELVMYKGLKTAKKKANSAVKKLTDYKDNKSHQRHIDIEECKMIGLKVVKLEENAQLQDLVLTVHHCYMHAFMNGAAYKIIENHLGSAFVKISAQVRRN